jgi:hypothetical protein
MLNNVVANEHCEAVAIGTLNKNSDWLLKRTSEGREPQHGEVDKEDAVSVDS